MKTLVSVKSVRSSRTVDTATMGLALAKNQIVTPSFDCRNSKNTKQTGPKMAPFDPLSVLVTTGHWSSMSPSERNRWTAPSPDDLVDLRTVAKLLDADLAVIGRWVRQGNVPAVLIERGEELVVRYQMAEIQRWLRSLAAASVPAQVRSGHAGERRTAIEPK